LTGGPFDDFEDDDFDDEGGGGGGGGGDYKIIKISTQIYQNKYLFLVLTFIIRRRRRR